MEVVTGIFQLKPDLLPLGAMEMDENLQRMIGDSTEVVFKNIKGDERAFKVDLDQNLIQSRGILGFFRPYKGEYLFLTRNQEGVCYIDEHESLPKNWMNKTFFDAEKEQRARTVAENMNYFREDGASWLDLYDRSWEFAADARDDSLICLPHVRDLEMYEYQERTVKAVLKKFRGRVLLSDEVGLGKTIEAGMAMLEYIMRGLVKKVLILVPPSLVDQWYFEMKRKFNQDFIRFDEPDFKNMKDEAWGHYDKVIASLSTAKRKGNSELITDIHYDLVIVDEAHHLKNRRTMAWDFVNRLNKKYIFLLSATPVQNNLEELYNLITLLKPGQLKTYSYFKKNFIGDREGMEARNVKDLKRLLAGVMIRNKRSDIDVKLTRRSASTIAVSFGPEEKRLYDDISTFVKSRYAKEGTGLTRFVLKNLQEQMGSSFESVLDTLERLSANEKINDWDRTVLKGFLFAGEHMISSGLPTGKLLKLLEIIQESQDKVLVFTKYLTTQKVITDFLQKQNVDTAVFNGGLRRAEKEAQIDLFKTKAKVLVSTETGGEGRNLQFCNRLVNYDLPWNPMAIEQRIGRIHRIGQTRDVFVYNLAAKDTVEYHILELLDKKINMFQLVVGEVDMILGDIEEKADFADIVMDAWVRATDEETMTLELEKLGAQLLENKNHYLKAKDLDEQLFSSLGEQERDI